MSDLKCKNCHKKFSSNQALRRHNERKFPCKAFVSKKDATEIAKNPENSKSSSMQKVCKIVCKKSAKLEKTEFEISCNYCKTVFSHTNALYKHRSHLRCEKMPKYEMARRGLKLKNKGAKDLSEITKIKMKSLKI